MYYSQYTQHETRRSHNHEAFLHRKAIQQIETGNDGAKRGTDNVAKVDLGYGTTDIGARLVGPQMVSDGEKNTLDRRCANDG